MILSGNYNSQKLTQTTLTHAYQEESNSSKHCYPRSKQPWITSRPFTTNASDCNIYQPLSNTKFYDWPPLWTRPTRLLLPLSNDQTHLHPPDNPRLTQPHLPPIDSRYDSMNDHTILSITNYRNSHSQYGSSALPQQHHIHTAPNTPINHLNAPHHTPDTHGKSDKSPLRGVIQTAHHHLA